MNVAAPRSILAYARHFGRQKDVQKKEKRVAVIPRTGVQGQSRRRFIAGIVFDPEAVLTDKNILKVRGGTRMGGQAGRRFRPRRVFLAFIDRIDSPVVVSLSEGYCKS